MPLLRNEYKLMKKVLEQTNEGSKYNFTDVIRTKLGENPFTFTANHVGVRNKTEKMKRDLAKLTVLAVDYIFVVTPEDQGK